MDGILDEEGWARTGVIDTFIQREPNEGEPASERTEVRVAYDDGFIYFGVHCFDKEPERIVATEMRRDGELKDNDYFEIYIDTYHDHRNAFYFMINALGARRDGQIRDEGVNLNWNWDGIWRVRARRHDRGWSAEIAIPFHTLRFPKADLQSWGINFGRLIARKREESYWAPISRDLGHLGKFKVSNCGHLLDLRNLRQGNRLQVLPYLIGGGAQNDRDEPFRGEIDAGLDMKVRMTADLTADITVNTDFAQVEADQEQFNLTRFNLYYPEKRSFFLEGADIFTVGERWNEYDPPTTLLFFSRSIGLDDERKIPILGGVRVTGKTGPYTVGMMNILTERVFDEDDPGLIATGRTNNAVVRLKRDFLQKSSFGLMYVSRSDLDGLEDNRVGAVDFDLAFGPSLKIRGFASKSSTPGLKGKDWASSLDFSYNTDLLTVDLTTTDIGDNFRSELGFISRSDIRKVKNTLGIGPRIPIFGLRKTFFFSSLLYIENHAGIMESRTNSLGMFNVFQNGGLWYAGWVRSYEFLEEEFEIKDDVPIPAGRYSFSLFSSFFETDKSRRLAMRGEFNAGGFYNGNLFRVNATGFLKLSRKFNMEFILDRNQFDLPVDGGRFTTNIAAARLIYSFSPDLFAKAYLQWNSTEELFKSNFQVRWIYKPGANIYFIYNETREVGRVGYLNDRVLLLKVSFLFNY